MIFILVMLLSVSLMEIINDQPALTNELLNSLSSADYSSLSKYYRLHLFIKSRVHSLNKYYDFHSKEIHLFSRLTCEVNFRKAILQLTTLLNRLDINSVILRGVNSDVYLGVLRQWHEFPRNVREHVVQIFGSFCEKEVSHYYTADKSMRESGLSASGGLFSGVPTAESVDFDFQSLSDFWKELRESQLHGRRAEVERRLHCEIESRCSDDKWFCVFNTLTVNPEYYSKVFSKEAKAWQRYIRSVDVLFGIAAYGSYASAVRARKSGNEFHTYFAVVEKGSLHGRLHIHVLHFFSHISKEFADPNLSAIKPNRREIDALRSYWKYGHSSPIAVRFSQGDAFGKAGWLWPVLPDGQPVVSKPPIALARYVSKYLTKAYDADNLHFNKESGGYTWRTRISRNLGKKMVTDYVETLSDERKLKVLMLKSLVSYRTVKLPKRMLFLVTLRHLIPYLLKIYNLRVSTLLLSWLPRKSLFERVKDLIQTTPGCSQRNCGLLKTLPSSNLDVSSRVFIPMKGLTYAV